MIQAVILESDGTHLTNFSGSKVFHALYMTLGNLYRHIRRQPQSGAWVLLAILPSSSFTQTLINLTSPQSYVKLNKNQAASLPGILKQHLYHECMVTVIDPLCYAKRRSHLVLGPGIKIHSSMACLVGYIADMKEQFMIAHVTSKACPICLAQPRLDNSTIQHHCTAKPHTGSSTLDVLYRVRNAHPDVPIWKFRTLVSKEKCGVSGYVEHPFWEDLDVRPSQFILYARISCMVLTSSFGTIHTNGLHHSLELSALTGESPCSQRKVCTISRVAFPSSNRHLEESTGTS